MISIFIFCAIFGQLSVFTGAARMPNYIHACSRTSSNFSACAIESAKLAIPHLIHGEKRLNMPKFAPMEISLIEVHGSNDFTVKLMDLEVYGLENVNPMVIDVNFEKRKAHVLSSIPRLFVTGNYELIGHILIFNLNGHGPVNLTMTDGLYTYDFEWEDDHRNGETYIKVTNSDFDYNLKQVTYNFENVFNGNDRMSEIINKAMNDNWEIVNADLKQSIKATLLAIHNDLFQRFFSQISIRELFKD